MTIAHRWTVMLLIVSRPFSVIDFICVDRKHIRWGWLSCQSCLRFNHKDHRFQTSRSRNSQHLAISLSNHCLSLENLTDTNSYKNVLQTRRCHSLRQHRSASRYCSSIWTVRRVWIYRIYNLRYWFDMLLPEPVYVHAVSTLTWKDR